MKSILKNFGTADELSFAVVLQGTIFGRSNDDEFETDSHLCDWP